MKKIDATHIVMGVCMLGIVAIAILMHHHEKALERDRDMLHRFCAASRMAIEQDEADLRSDDPTRRDTAFINFYESDKLYHSEASLQYCLAPVPALPLQCRLDRDYTCLAKVAHEIASQLP